MTSIIEQLPYQTPFLFVDTLETVSEEGATGSYTLKDDEFFYAGHFPGNPVTPGVILTEIAAQIGLVALGIHLKGDSDQEVMPVFSSAQVDFLKPVYPGETVKVISKKEYFRFNKLKCSFEMFGGQENLVCKGNLSGMIVDKNERND